MTASRETPSIFENKGFLLALVLLATLAAYLQVIRFDFVNFDDGAYVTQNPYVQMGIRVESFKWAWTSLYHSNWFPLSWLSHMLVYQFFGLHAGAHHAVNLILHLLNTALLYLFLFRLTGAWKKSLMAAALFALHPLHVESVAWVAERKDVLSAFFALLSALAYGRYAKQKTGSETRKAYFLTALFFILALLSKPMPITLPLIFLLLDYWPLQRFGKISLRSLLFEKIPFFLISAASGAVTFAAQKLGDSVPVLDRLPLEVRLQNVIISYAKYLKKMVYPVDLAVYYPYTRDTIFIGKVIAAVFVIIMISLVVAQHGRRRPYLIVGWLWYLTMLLPVIGLIQVGGQALADRYTYLPLVGIFIMLVWGIPDLLSRWKKKEVFLPIFSIGILTLLTMMCARQVGYWKNTETLFLHAAAVTKRNALAHGVLADDYSARGKIREAVYHYERANAIQPQPDVLINLGNAYFSLGRIDDAMRVYAEAIQRDPRQPIALANFGIMLAEKKRFKEAEGLYSKAIEVDPAYLASYTALAEIQLRQGRFYAAWKNIETVLQKDPANPVAIYFLGILHLQSKTFKIPPPEAEVPRSDTDFTDPTKEFEEMFFYQGDIEKAFESFERVLQINPRFYLASVQWGVALAVQGKYEEAKRRFEEVLAYQPQNGLMLGHIGRLHAMQNHSEEALRYYTEALKFKTDLPRVHKRMGDLLLGMGKEQEAKEQYEEAVYLLPDYEKAKEKLDSLSHTAV